MEAREIATRAADLVDGVRDRQHGDKVENFGNIASLWNAYLENIDAPLTPVDVAHMMVLMKVARTQTGQVNPDDWVDMAGYAACAGDIALR